MAEWHVTSSPAPLFFAHRDANAPAGEWMTEGSSDSTPGTHCCGTPSARLQFPTLTAAAICTVSQEWKVTLPQGVIVSVPVTVPFK